MISAYAFVELGHYPSTLVVMYTGKKWESKLVPEKIAIDNDVYVCIYFY